MKRILLVAMPFSIHTKRWIEAMRILDIEIHLFSSFEYSNNALQFDGIIYHDYLDNLHNNPNKSLQAIDNKFLERLGLPIILLKFIGKIKRRLGLKKPYAFYLRRTIININPDTVHTLETQHAGYSLLKSIQNFDLPISFNWVHSTWGIDLHYFCDIESHKTLIIHMLSLIDILCIEGKRDLELARNFGFNNRYFIFPSVGGFFDISNFETPPSKREFILLKGYENEQRKGLNALKGVELSQPPKKFKIIIYGATPSVVEYASACLIKDQIVIKSHLQHSEMIDLTKKSIISITNNLTDGLPNSFIEAMACGAFPIQSNTSMADEWIEQRKTGILVDPENIAEISQAIQFALDNTSLMDRAAIVNRNIFEKSFNKDLILSRMKQLYFN